MNLHVFNYCVYVFYNMLGVNSLQTSLHACILHASAYYNVLSVIK